MQLLPRYHHEKRGIMTYVKSKVSGEPVHLYSLARSIVVCLRFYQGLLPVKANGNTFLLDLALHRIKVQINSLVTKISTDPFFTIMHLPRQIWYWLELVCPTEHEQCTGIANKCKYCLSHRVMYPLPFNNRQ